MFAAKYLFGSGLKPSFLTTTASKVHEGLIKIMSCRANSDSPDSRSKLTTYKLESKVATRDNDFKHYTASPFKTPGPRRYGLVVKYERQGLLPRDGIPVRSLPPFRPKDQWTPKKALFGQNDYIDILGDGDVHPADLLTGPRWLIGFKGNERDRMIRKMEWEGPRLKVFYPSEYNRIEKRIRYLTKLYNVRRCRRWAD
ncbi:hypothetical protein BsWGS_26557 [Bradybaena similaris]